MTKARILGQNHSVITYELNGRKRHIVEDIPQTNNRKMVNLAIRHVNSRDWAKVTNYIDSQGGLPDPAVERTIESMTY